MKIRKINDKEVDRDMSFNKMELLKFCIRNTLNDFYEDDDFLFEVFWSLLDMNIDETEYNKDGMKDNYLEIESGGKVKVKNIEMVYNDIILKCEKLYEEISENEERFSSRMILFGDE
jgi:hypothetical protein